MLELLSCCTADLQSCYIRHVLEPERNSLGRTESAARSGSMLRESRKYFLLVTLAAFALRLFFYFRFPHVTGDSLIYGDIAKNWLDHGIFGLTHAEGPRPPGSACPAIPRSWPPASRSSDASTTTPCCWCRSSLTWPAASSSPTWRAGPCPTARRDSPFSLAALCPVHRELHGRSAGRDAEHLLRCGGARLRPSPDSMRQTKDVPRWSAWTGCGVAVAAGILLRPDGGILLVALGLFLLWRMWRTAAAARAPVLGGSAGAGDLAVARWCRGPSATGATSIASSRWPHVTPTILTSLFPSGFDKWMRTWIVDYVSTEEVYWQVPGRRRRLADCCRRGPSTARRSARRRRPSSTITPRSHFVGPELNARFAELAKRAHSRASAALLRLAADVAHRRHVAAPAHRNAAARLALVGVCRRPA